MYVIVCAFTYMYACMYTRICIYSKCACVYSVKNQFAARSNCCDSSSKRTVGK